MESCACPCLSLWRTAPSVPITLPPVPGLGLNQQRVFGGSGPQTEWQRSKNWGLAWVAATQFETWKLCILAEQLLQFCFFLLIQMCHRAHLKNEKSHMILHHSGTPKRPGQGRLAGDVGSGLWPLHCPPGCSFKAFSLCRRWLVTDLPAQRINQLVPGVSLALVSHSQEGGMSAECLEPF